MMQGFSLGSYVQLVDYTGRIFRQGKASISAELAGIFERIGCRAKTGRTGWKGFAMAGCWAISLRRPAQAAGDCSAPGNAAHCERGGLSRPMTGYRITSNGHRRIASM